MKLKIFERIVNKIKAFSTFFFFKIIDYLVLFPSIKSYKKNSLLIVRLDAIGDYILFRNFIKFLKEDPIYNNYDIYLCGNSIWKDIAERYDKAYIKEFFWVNKVNLNTNILYRIKTLRNFNKIKFDVIINPQFSRDYYSESIINCINAREKIASSGDLSNVRHFQKRISDKYYTRLIPQNEPFLFEFYRNKDFFQKLLNKTIDIPKPTLSITSSIKNNTIIVFPGAGLKYRRWHEDNFAEVAKFLLNNFNVKIIILGGREDIELSNKIEYLVNDNNLINLAGKTSLPKTAEILANSKFLIANETSIIHLAVAVDTPFLCISNGNHYGRFNPYPVEIFNKGKYVYPAYVNENIFNYTKLVKEFCFTSPLNINEIKTETINLILKELLTNNN